VAADRAGDILDLIARGSTASNADTLAGLRNAAGGDEPMSAAISDLERIVALSAGTSAGPRVRLDPSLARGLSYYTGAIMEIAVPDLAGSLGGGGRYDGLIGMFSGDDVPACGFSLGLERILVVMSERGMFPDTVSASPADVLVTQWNEARAADTLALAASMRAAGLRVDVYPDFDKLGRQFKYAASRGIPHVVVLGDDEVSRGEVTIKDMRSGEQRAVPRDQAAASLAAR
jgi:histidyl-tRNA synthetase